MQAGAVRIFCARVTVAAIFALRFAAGGVADSCAAFFASFQSALQASRGGVSLLTEPSASLQTSRRNDQN